MRILICNDDGVMARGIEVLYDSLRRALGTKAEIHVVAPLEEKSTTGHSLTLHKPLRLVPMKNGFFGVNGSPADCVQLGTSFVFKKKPHWVISGINRGANLGQDIYYSGTVSAAREAAIMQIPSIAVSLAIDFKKRHNEVDLHYETAGKVTARMFKFLNDPKHADLHSTRTLFNINVPDRPYSKLKGLVSVRQGFRHYSTEILKRRDHRGKDYYWVGGAYMGFQSEAGTDCERVDRGFATITPMQLDTTDQRLLQQMQLTLKPRGGR